MSSFETPSNFIALESIHIATPCHADWDKMSGDDRVRFCGSCAKNVYNLSSMTRADAERLVAEKEGNLCVQFHRREDGTVLTSDCPVGISPVRKPTGFVRAFVAGVMAAIVGIFGVKSTVASDRPAEMGDVAIPVKAEPPKLMGKIVIPKAVATPTPTPDPEVTPTLGMVAIRGEIAPAPKLMAVPKKSSAKTTKPVKSHTKTNSKTK